VATAVVPYGSTNPAALVWGSGHYFDSNAKRHAVCSFKDAPNVPRREPDRFADYPARGSVTNLCASGLRYSEHVAGDGPRFRRQACQLGLEGAISMRPPVTAGSG
jgi:hypothetical protein